MRRRVDVDEALPAVSIPSRVLHELFQHARHSAPEECCGLIVGTEREPFARAVPCRNEMTRLHQQDPSAWPRDNRNGFYMRPDDYRPWLEPEGEERVTAVYHSHVGFGCYLSDEDLAYAEHALFPFPEADQIVVSVGEERVEAALFRRSGPGAAFVGSAVTAEPA